MRRLLALVLLLFLVSADVAVVPPGDSDRPLVFDGLDRHYLLHVPSSYDGSAAVPLVLDFHGLTSNAVQQKGISGMVAVSDQAGFLVAHPDGVRNAWNAGTCCGNAEVDDVGFIRAVVADLEGAANIDARRVYATGLSNGGAITQRLACDAADLFAAAAPMAFPIPARPISECRPSRTIPVLTFMGLTDVLVRYDNGAFGSAPGTLDYWHDLDGCSGDIPDVTEVTGLSRCERFTHCQSGVEAGLCSITAHSFVGTAFEGHVLYFNDDLNLAQVAWAFLSRFTLPKKVVAELHGLAKGTEELAVPGQGPVRDQVEWEIGLGAGTWWASDGAGTYLTGNARPRGHGHWVLSLTSASRAALLAALGQRASSVVGAEVTYGAAGSERLVASAAGRHVRIVGQLGLADGSGAAVGSYRVKLRGRLSR